MDDRERQDPLSVLRTRLADAKLRLDFVNAHLKEIQGDFPPGDVDGDFALQQAIRAQNVALAEYNRVLRIYTELVTRTKHSHS